MKNVYTTLGFALGASAATLSARDSCCFSLTASGGKTGVVGQLGDGQNRIGQTSGLANGQGTYCINNGGLTDGNGRGCILTPPTTQFQCDVGASPTTGFAVNSNGDLTYNGNTQFYACATGDNGGYNIYTTISSAQTGCVKVGLNTGGKCSGSNGSGSSSMKQSSASSASMKQSSAPPASSAPASSAPPASKPASSAPPASMPPAGPTTVYKTTTIYVTSCPANCAATNGGGMPSAPASMPAGSGSMPAGSAPPASAPPASMPASSAPPASKPASSAPPASAPPASMPAPAPSGTSAGSACPVALTGAYQTPHAIIPVNKDMPSTSYGTQYFAYLSSSNSTIFNFDIPSSYAGKQCSVIFLFPKQSELQTSSFTMSGAGGIKFDQLTSAAPLNVNYATCPAVKTNLGMVANATPGNSYMVATGACQAGTTMSILASSTGGLSLSYFEDWNPSPIGLFLTSC